MTEHFPSGGEAFPDGLHLQPQQPEPVYLDDRHLAFLSDPDMLSVPLDRGFQDIQRNGDVDPERVPRRLRMMPIIDRTGGYTPTEYVVRPITSLEAMQQVGASILDINFDDGIRLHCASLLAQDRKSAVADMLLNGVKDDILRMQSRTILGEYASMEVTVDQFNADYSTRTADKVLNEWVRVCGWEKFYVKGVSLTPWQYFANGDIWGEMPFTERILHQAYGEAMALSYKDVNYCDVAEKYFARCRKQYPELERVWNPQIGGMLVRAASSDRTDAFDQLLSLSRDKSQVGKVALRQIMEHCHGLANLKTVINLIKDNDFLIEITEDCSTGYYGYSYRLTRTANDRDLSGEWSKDNIKAHQIILEGVLARKAEIGVSVELEDKVSARLAALRVGERVLQKLIEEAQLGGKDRLWLARTFDEYLRQTHDNR